MYEEHRQEERRATTRPLNTKYPVMSPGDEPAMMRYLAGRRLDGALAKLNGWYPSRAANSRYAYDGLVRIVMPALTKVSGSAFWQSRDITGTDPKRFSSPAAPRGDAVIVVWPRKVEIRTLVCEGPMDALAAAELGYTGVALMGVNPPTDSLVLTASLVRGTMCTVLADSDSLSDMALVTAFLASQGAKARLMGPGTYKDLADAPPEERARILA